MKRLVLILLLAACDNDRSNTPGTTDLTDACDVGCEETIRAACTLGPATQDSCEADCEDLRDGSCGGLYEDYLSCSYNEAVSCDGDGFPFVPACEDEQLDFEACL